MAKRMLIDATHAEETRVVVLDGNRLEDFDVETSTKKQLKGNIYLAKIVRVEPSLQAAFVEYGGGRHGFLAFGEIHPDYYQIPVADRQRLLKLQAEEAREEEDDDELPAAKPAPTRGRRGRTAPVVALDAPAAPTVYGEHDGSATPTAYGEVEYGAVEYGAGEYGAQERVPADETGPAEPPAPTGEGDDGPVLAIAPATDDAPRDDPTGDDAAGDDAAGENGTADRDDLDVEAAESDLPPPETMGGDSDVFEGNGAEEAAARRTSRFLRNYRIQEVIRRRQIILIQVVKEERGTKGAALTTYISLAGRFCVLMPNSPRGGGISRKITSTADRRRLKEITAELEIPNGMGLIVRTAGANRPKPEIRRDCEYLMRLWDDIREHTLASMAPALIYEEASLIKRAIRDGYSRDIDEVVVDGEAGWRAAHDFMRMLMPSHAKKVQLWRPNGASQGGGQPLFAKHGVEDQLDSMLSPTVQLKSGGYLVINQAEALVAIDVNSGRSTRERGIEETALRTNLEAAEEAARQLRLRDLAGLIVIDFIDMDAKKHNAMVEHRLKEALKNDRARIQVGQISHFGLLEMSRQRLRPSLTEASFVSCPHCAGLGLVRNVESAAIHVLRDIEDEGAKARAGHIMVHVANAVAMYLLNNKRDRLADIEARYAMRVHFTGDETLVPPQLRIDRLKPPLTDEERAALAPPPVAPAAPQFDAGDADDEDELPDVTVDADEPARAEVAEPSRTRRGERAIAATAAPAAEAAGEVAGDMNGGADEAERRRRRRRRRGGRREDGEDSPIAAGATSEGANEAPSTAVAAAVPEGTSAADGAVDGSAVDGPPLDGGAESEATAPLVAAVAAGAEQPSLDPEDLDENGLPKARRRGRRGGKRRRRDDGTEAPAEVEPAVAPVPASVGRAASVAPPVYTGPTPADPFGGQPFDIFDLLERAEQAEAERSRSAQASTGLEIPPVPANATPPADLVAEPAVFDTPVAPAEPEPVAAEPETVAAVAAAEPVVAEPVASEPGASPAVRPIVLGEDPLPSAEPKRGWWKR